MISCRKKLTDAELQTILILLKKKYSISQSYWEKKRPGRPKALTTRDKCAIIRVTSSASMTAEGIAEVFRIKTNVTDVQRILQQCKHLQRKNLQKKPLFTEAYKGCKKYYYKPFMQVARAKSVLFRAFLKTALNVL
ncbi:uncharacterized protein LOC117226697 [Megalopta genalis]|uniref:uncharacterized protein LOC117226697 n=1 Tax=Megalopta genalis TaxID=115081 RepID=UPI003FD52184